MPKYKLKSPEKRNSKLTFDNGITELIVMLGEIISQQHEFYKSDPRNARLYQKIILSAADSIAAFRLMQKDGKDGSVTCVHSKNIINKNFESL